MARRISGARFFDIETISDARSSLSKTIPPADAFAAAMDSLGVRNEDTVVVYASASPAWAAARCWWHIKAMGHSDVRVLDGGLAAWRAAGFEVDESPTSEIAVEEPGQACMRMQDGPSLPHHLIPPTYRPSDPTPDRPGGLFARKEDILASLDAGAPSLTIMDARGRGRFTGETPEARPGLRSGHIPGSASVPYASLVDADGRMLAPDELREVIETSGVELGGEGDVVATCGSGVTACVIALALEQIGHGERVAVYDGSWSDWGREDSGCPVEVGL